MTLLDGKSQGALHTHFAPINLFDCSGKMVFAVPHFFVFLANFEKLDAKLNRCDNMGKNHNSGFVSLVFDS